MALNRTRYLWQFGLDLDNETYADIKNTADILGSIVIPTTCCVGLFSDLLLVGLLLLLGARKSSMRLFLWAIFADSISLVYVGFVAVG